MRTIHVKRGPHIVQIAQSIAGKYYRQTNDAIWAPITKEEFARLSKTEIK